MNPEEAFKQLKILELNKLVFNDKGVIKQLKPLSEYQYEALAYLCDEFDYIFIALEINSYE